MQKILSPDVLSSVSTEEETEKKRRNMIPDFWSEMDGAAEANYMEIEERTSSEKLKKAKRKRTSEMLKGPRHLLNWQEDVGGTLV